MRTKPVFFLKLGLGLALLAWLLLREDTWADVVALFADLSLPFLVPFLAVNLLLILISCLKWQLFLKERGTPVKIPALFGYYLIGYFFNNFLPTNFGGDVARSYYLGNRIRSQGQSAASVLLERLTGLVALVTVAVAAFALTRDLLADTLVTGSLALIAGGCAGLVVALWYPEIARAVLRPLERLAQARRLPLLPGLIRKLYAFQDHVGYFKDKPALIARAMGYSFVFHLFTVVNVYTAALTLGVEVDFLRLAVVTPIILVLASLPLTPNSIGIWEWAFSFYLVSAGATAEQGLAIALLIRAATLAFSVVGGILFLLEGRNAKVATAPSDLPSRQPGAH